MLFCQHCKKRIDEDLVFCPKCREVLVEEDARWQDFDLQGEVEQAKERANMYVILAVVLVTLGMMGGSVLLVSWSLLGLFGIVFVCLGVGFAAAADWHARKARTLKRQLGRCD